MSTITISTVTLLEILLGGVVIGLSAWVFTGPKPTTSSTGPPGSLNNNSSSKKSKVKKRKGTQLNGTEPTPPEKVPTPPGPKPAQQPTPPPVAAQTPAPSTTQKKSKTKSSTPAGVAPPAGPTPAPVGPPTTTSPSFAAIANPGPTPTPTNTTAPRTAPPISIPLSTTRSKSPSSRSPVIKPNNKMRPPESVPSPTLSASGPSRGATSDMLEREDSAAPARVMRVMGGKLGALPPVGEWEDWHTREDEDNGWEVASKAKKPAKTSLSASGYSPAFSASNPAPAARSIPGLSAADQASLTKKQQQNQAKKARAAADKEEQERDRLQRLAEHRRQLENARAAEAEKARTKNAPKKGGPRSEHVGASRKATSHGQMAQVDNNGHLIWD